MRNELVSGLLLWAQRLSSTTTATRCTPWRGLTFRSLPTGAGEPER